MAITLGKAGTGAPNFGDNIISATKNDEADVIDITSRSTDNSANPAYREFDVGLPSSTWEIECYDPTGLLSDLTTQLSDDTYGVVSVSENITLDGPNTYTVTLRQG